MMLKVLSCSFVLASTSASYLSSNGTHFNMTGSKYCHLSDREKVDQLTDLQIEAGRAWFPKKLDFSKDAEALRFLPLGKLISGILTVRAITTEHEYIAQDLYSHLFCPIGAESLMGLMKLPQWTEREFLLHAVETIKFQKTLKETVDIYSDSKHDCNSNYESEIRGFIEEYVKGNSITAPEHAIAIIALKGILGSSLDGVMMGTELGDLKTACERARQDREIYVKYGLFLLSVYNSTVSREKVAKITDRVSRIEMNMVGCLAKEEANLVMPVKGAILQKVDYLWEQFSGYVVA